MADLTEIETIIRDQIDVLQVYIKEVTGKPWKLTLLGFLEEGKNHTDCYSSLDDMDLSLLLLLVVENLTAKQTVEPLLEQFEEEGTNHEQNSTTCSPPGG